MKNFRKSLRDNINIYNTNKLRHIYKFEPEVPMLKRLVMITSSSSLETRWPFIHNSRYATKN